MQYSTEIVAVIVAVIGLIGLIILLRFTHFEKVIEEQLTKIDNWSSEIRNSLVGEIKKHKTADIEDVINTVNMLSAVDSMTKRLKGIGKGMQRAFILDFITIGFLIVLALAFTIQTQFDAYTLLFLVVAIMFVFGDISAFVSMVREFYSIKENIREKKTNPEDD